MFRARMVDGGGGFVDQGDRPRSRHDAASGGPVAHPVAKEGLSGLDDRPRPGGRASASMTRRRTAASGGLGRPPPEGGARWTGGLVAEALGDVSDRIVAFLRAKKIDLDGRKSGARATIPIWSPRPRR